LASELCITYGISKNSVVLRIAETGHPDHLEIWILAAFGVSSEAVNMFLIQKPVNPKPTPVARVIQRNETT
jgi:hypothetical protein